jgi:hypothetical protein
MITEYPNYNFGQPVYNQSLVNYFIMIKKEFLLLLASILYYSLLRKRFIAFR